MNTLMIAAALYLVSASVIEAAVQALYRFYKDLRKAFAAIRNRELDAKKIKLEWSVIARWLSLILSVVLVKLVGITFIVLLLQELFELEPNPTLATMDIVLTGLVISRGSNFLHDFITKQKKRVDSLSD